MSFFSMLFNKNENQFLSLAFDLQNHVRLENLENYSAFSVTTVKKTAFNSVPLTVFLLYRPKKQSSTNFHECLQNLVDSKSLGVIEGDIKMYLVIARYTNWLLKNSTRTKHIGVPILNHVYIKNTIMELFDVYFSILNTYFFNYTVRLALSPKEIDFQIMYLKEMF